MGELFIALLHGIVAAVFLLAFLAMAKGAWKEWGLWSQAMSLRWKDLSDPVAYSFLATVFGFLLIGLLLSYAGLLPSILQPLESSQ